MALIALMGKRSAQRSVNVCERVDSPGLTTQHRRTVAITIESNFNDDLRAWCLDWVACAGYKVRDVPPNAVEAARIYFKARQRLISHRPRKVIWSSKLRVAPLAEWIREALDAIAAESMLGRSLCPRLSRAVANLQSKDGMLFDWGIYHLHLGAGTEPDGFIKRTGPILFVLVREDILYFIDVKPHGKDSWVDRSILDTIDIEWPETIADYLLSAGTMVDDVGLTSVAPAATTNARRIGINILWTTPSGRAYASPGGGLTIGGGSGWAMLEASRLCRQVDRFEEALRAHTDQVAAECNAKAGRELTELRFHLLVGAPLKAREIQTGVEFEAGS